MGKWPENESILSYYINTKRVEKILSLNPYLSRRKWTMNDT